MSYRIEQTIKGTTYVYEVTAYWDKEKKQPRQKRICLGKKDANTNELIPSKARRSPRMCREYGNYYVLNTIADRIGLAGIIQRAFPDIWSEILTCAFFEISERKPLYLCEPWSESTQTPSPAPITSQRISELLQILGQRAEERMAFFCEWAKLRSEQEYLAFDITSISSYSKLIEQLEYGYNRDGENLTQINLGMLFGQTSLLPIYYTVYPGSIRDVNTLTNMIRYAKHLNIKTIRFILDKGFYSERNIDDLIDDRAQFAVALPFTTGLAQTLVAEVRKTIGFTSNALMHNDDIYQASTKTIKHHRTTLKAFVFYNERKFLDAKETLLKKILALEALIREKQSVSGMADECLKYLRIQHTGQGLAIQRDQARIDEALRHKGYLIILSNAIMDAQEALSLYRAKDAVERAFDNLKNELDMKRLRVHSETAMAGRLFVGFIALILHSWINKRMKDTQLYRKWTQEEVMMELKKLKRIDLDSGTSLLTEISKKQNMIFKAFQIRLPSLT